MGSVRPESVAERFALIFLIPAVFLAGCVSTVSKLSRSIIEPRKSIISIAFTGAALISMTGDGVRRNQTVLIENGRISAIGDPGQVILGQGTQIVDARGKYLLPGFIDMHVHISDEADLPLLLMNGVTTVRNMADLPGWVKAVIGFPDVISLRLKIRSNSLLGPDIYTAGLALDGAPPVSPFNRVVKTAQEAEREIGRLSRGGYDYVKIYDMLSMQAFGGIMASARSYELPVVGHVPFRVGLERVLESDVLSIEHLTGYIDNNKADFIIPRDELGKWAEKTKERNIYNCPTLVIWDRLPAPGASQELSRYAEFQFVSRRIRWLWRKTLQTVYEIDYSPKETYPARMMDISRQMLRELHEKECKLLIGTDMNFVGVFPGISTLREIELFVENGIRPLEALRAATVNAAECLGKADLFGTIAVGKRADLLLLNGDPLAGIQNIYDIAGVMVRGLWLDTGALTQISDGLRKKAQQ